MKTLGERLEHVIQTCGYATRADFARAINQSPQAVQNWIARGKIGGPAQGLIKSRTGASIDWLMYGDGDPFPNGPILAMTATDEAIYRLRSDIDAVRSILSAMATAVTSASPETGAAVVAILRDAKAALPVDRGFLREFVDHVELTRVAAEKRQRGASAGGRKSHG